MVTLTAVTTPETSAPPAPPTPPLPAYPPVTGRTAPAPLDPPQPLPDGVPVFGKVDDRVAVPTKQFGLEVRYRHRGKKVTEQVPFTVYTKLDAGGILRLMQAQTEMEQANATAFVLATSLLDDDGVPTDWSPPGIDEPALEDEGDLDSRALRGEPTEVDPEGPLLYERWDGELVPYDDLGYDEFRDGSSRRRFAFIMSSTYYRVELDALIDTSKWLIEQSGGRPTGRPASSGRGPQSTPRGSGRKR
jgi:hypothetical protein